jgi:hypothetical protein
VLRSGAGRQNVLPHEDCHPLPREEADEVLQGDRRSMYLHGQVPLREVMMLREVVGMLAVLAGVVILIYLGVYALWKFAVWMFSDNGN